MNRRSAARYRLRTLAALSALSCASALYAGQATTSIADDTAQLIEELNSPDVQKRERATTLLLQSDTLDESGVLEMLASADLSPEQRRSLDTVLYERYRRGPIGAIGIRFSAEADPDARGLVVQNVVREAGFPAVEQEVIQDGDIIREVAGISLTEILRSGLNDAEWQEAALKQDFARARTKRANAQVIVQQQVFSRRPGESVPMLIERGVPFADEPIVLEVDVTLGNRAGHNEASLLPHQVATGAWRARLARLTGEQRRSDITVPTGETLWPDTRVTTLASRRFVRHGVVGGSNELGGVWSGGIRRSVFYAADQLRGNFMRQARETVAEMQKLNMQAGGRIAAQPIQQMRAVPNVNRAPQIRLQAFADSTLQDASDEDKIEELDTRDRALVLRHAKALERLAELRTRLAGTSDPAAQRALQELIDEAAVRIEGLREDLALPAEERSTNLRRRR